MPVPAGGDAADLFTIEEFVSYLQEPEFDTLTATLARELATAEIRLEVGSGLFDSLTDLTPFKAIALAVAKRVVMNPSGLRSSQIDDYSQTYATESLADADLTEAEKEKIGRIVGRSCAFTVRPGRSADDLAADVAFAQVTW